MLTIFTGLLYSQNGICILMILSSFGGPFYKTRAVLKLWWGECIWDGNLEDQQLGGYQAPKSATRTWYNIIIWLKWTQTRNTFRDNKVVQCLVMSLGSHAGSLLCARNTFLECSNGRGDMIQQSTCLEATSKKRWWRKLAKTCLWKENYMQLYLDTIKESQKLNNRLLEEKLRSQA